MQIGGLGTNSTATLGGTLQIQKSAGHDGYYEKVDRAAAGLEPDSRPDGYLFCRAYA